MTPELDKKLCKKYPKIFQERNLSMSETCMCWGFPGDGWYKIIEDICEEMVRVKKLTGIQFVARQVKEKYGTLRFYFIDDGRLLKLSDEERRMRYDKMRVFVSGKEIESATICEYCGDTGNLRTDGWSRTLCDKCEDKYQKGIRL